MHIGVKCITLCESSYRVRKRQIDVVARLVSRVLAQLSLRKNPPPLGKQSFGNEM